MSEVCFFLFIITFYLLTFQPAPVQVCIFWFGQCWIFVEEVGHKGQVEFGAPADDVSRGDKLSAAKPLSLLQHGFSPLQVVTLLKHTQRAAASGHTHAAQLVPRRGWTAVSSTYIEA